MQCTPFLTVELTRQFFCDNVNVGLMYRIAFHACRPHTTYLPLPSSWAPVGMNSYKPWLDENDSQHVFFSSINLHAESNFYPCSGGDTEGLPVESEPASPEEAMRVRRLHQENQDNILNIGLTPVGPGPWDPKQRAKLSTSHRAELCYKASREMRYAARFGSVGLCLR